MPLLLTRKIDTHTMLGIWELRETPVELLQLLPPYINVGAITGKVHPRRQR